MVLDQISFNFKGKVYKTEPLTTGRLIDYHKMRVSLSGGTYQSMYSDYVGTPMAVPEAIDMQAFLTVFCNPHESTKEASFIRDLKPLSINDLGIADLMELLSMFRKDIVPYLKQINDFLAKKEES